MVRDHVDEVIMVSEEDIVAAMRVCYERMKARSRLDRLRTAALRPQLPCVQAEVMNIYG